jgi:hypothetical protein
MNKAALLLVLSAAGASAQSYSYVLTTGLYDYTDNLLTAVQSEFGANATVADFADLKTAFADNPQNLVEILGGSYGSSAFVWYNGQQYFGGNRGYFASVHNGTVPGGWMVHDQIGGNIVDLGSWYITDMRILAVIPVPEPSTYGLGLGALALAGVALRRRRVAK